MMKPDLINQLVDELEQLARDCPQQSEWLELIDRVRKEMTMSHPRPKPRTPRSSSSAPDAERSCCICEVSTAVEGKEMCADCAAMYRAVSARGAPGLCTCGHAADGAKVYLYHKGGDEQTLCGLRCAKTHFQSVFTVFRGVRGDRHGRNPH